MALAQLCTSCPSSVPTRYRGIAVPTTTLHSTRYPHSTQGNHVHNHCVRAEHDLTCPTTKQSKNLSPVMSPLVTSPASSPVVE